jgi:cyanate permease
LHSLRFLLIARVIQGIGIAISYPVLAALIMAWFPKREQPYINTAFAAFAFLGTGTAMIWTAALFHWFGGSWRYALGCHGASILATAVGWLIIAPSRRHAVYMDKTTADGAIAGEAGSLSKALRMPSAWALALGTFAAAWVYNMYFSFVPLFLETGRGISLADASRLASLLPFSGVAGVIAFGVLAGRPAWRRHLLWTSCAVVILGSIALFWGDGVVTKLGMVVAGFGLSGFIPVSITYLMSLPSMTPSLVAALFVMVNLAVYMSGPISPVVVGWVSQSSFGLRNTLALFSWMELLAIVMFLRLPVVASGDPKIESTSTARL